MVDTPQDRPAELRKAVEAFGGRLHQFFFAFGEYDGISIVEFPNNETCAACAVTLTGAGANTTLQTTVLLTAKQEGGHAAGERGSSRLSVTCRLRQPGVSRRIISRRRGRHSGEPRVRQEDRRA
jgi:uncharacterized protein with GYD domain